MIYCTRCDQSLSTWIFFSYNVVVNTVQMLHCSLLVHFQI